MRRLPTAYARVDIVYRHHSLRDSILQRQRRLPTAFFSLLRLGSMRVCHTTMLADSSSTQQTQFARSNSPTTHRAKRWV